MRYDDLPLDRPEGRPFEPPPEQRSPTRWILVGAAGVIAVVLLALWWMSRTQPHPVTPAPTSRTDVAVAPNRPLGQPMDLPPLVDSDALLRDLVSKLSQHPLITRFLATSGLVRGATLAVVQIGDGKTPSVPLKVLRPDTRLQIRGSVTGTIDPASYARWDAATSALTSINPADAAQVYVNVKDLFDEAYREQGFASGNFDEAIVRAITRLAETPRVTGDPVVLRRSGFYEYEDEALRRIPPVQRQLLLVGPANRDKVMTWLRRFADRLDLTIEKGTEVFSTDSR
jgi:hypothetical protein